MEPVNTLQICIAHALHRGIVVIPKTVTASRITENLKATQIKLDTEDMERLREVGNRNFRFLKVRSRNLSFLNCYTVVTCHHLWGFNLIIEYLSVTMGEGIIYYIYGLIIIFLHYLLYTPCRGTFFGVLGRMNRLSGMLLKMKCL